MQPKVRFYMDESGHSGPNLFDLAQPVFSVGVVALRDPDALRRSFEAAAKNITGLNGPYELKSSVLLNSARGRREIRKLYGEIARHSLGTLFVIIEKRCFAAHALVTFFLDPDYTPGLKKGWKDGDAIHEATQAAYKYFPDDLLRSFVSGFYDSDLNQIKAARDQAIKVVRTIPDAEVGALSLIEGLTDAILNDEVAYLWKATPAKKKQVASPNAGGFMSAFGLVARHSVNFRIERPEIVHDNQIEFAPVFEGILELLRQGEDGIIDYGKGAPTASGAAAEISVSFENSAGSIGLVAADLVAGIVRWAAAKTASPGPVSCKDQSERDLLELVGGLVLNHDQVRVVLGRPMPFDFHAIITDEHRSRLWECGRSFKVSSL